MDAGVAPADISFTVVLGIFVSVLLIMACGPYRKRFFVDR